MTVQLLIEDGIAEVRAALIEDGRLVEIAIHRRGDPVAVGGLFQGRVARLVPGINAAFIDIGRNQSGFLAARDAQALRPAERRPGGDGVPQIGACLTEGQSVTVQITKQPIVDKRPRLTANLALPGRYLVYRPLGAGVSVSKRILEGPERQRWLDWTPPAASGGWIIRTAAADRPVADIDRDAAWLLGRWREISRAATGAPAPLGAVEADLESLIRDLAPVGGGEVVLDSIDALTRARAYARRSAPDLEGRLRGHEGSVALFVASGVEAEIEAALSARVDLASGGAITIEETQALTAIDVDSGSFTSGRSQAGTALRVNCEAAEEAARQLRLRRIGGIIVIDFILQDSRADRDRVVAVLGAALARDSVATRMLGMNEFGLVELTRRRDGESLAGQLLARPARPEPRPTPAQAVAEALRRAEREAADLPPGPLLVRLPPEIAALVTPAEVGELGRRAARAARIEPVPSLVVGEVEVLVRHG